MLNADVVTVWEWLGTFILLAIPVVNIIMFVIWLASSDTKPSKRNFILAQLILIGIMTALIIVIAIIVAAMGIAV